VNLTMKPRPSRLLLPLFFAVACLSASAQDKIVLSAPADNGNTDTNSPITDENDRHINADDYQAPKHFFNNSASSLPMPRPIYLGNVSREALKEADKQRNWTLLTPEQILGVQTPDSILGIDKLHADRNLSLEDQYLQRLHRPATGGSAAGKTDSAAADKQDNLDSLNQRDLQPAMNGLGSGRLFKRSFDPGGGFGPSVNADAGQAGQARDLSQLFNQANSQSSDQQTLNSPWTSPFAQPAQPKPSQEQIDSWNSFQALLNPNSPPGQTPKPAPVSFSDQTPSATDSYFQRQPQYNPAGSSVNLLEDNATLPTGLQPLPGISGSSLNQPLKQPDWKPQAPPWLRTGPQAR
jgi:hypothetical protein